MKIVLVVALVLLSLDVCATHTPSAADIVDRPNCPEPSEVDTVIRSIRTIRECRFSAQCNSTENCCDTTDRIAVCIPKPPSDIGTTTSSTSQITSGNKIRTFNRSIETTNSSDTTTTSTSTITASGSRTTEATSTSVTITTTSGINNNTSGTTSSTSTTSSSISTSTTSTTSGTTPTTTTSSSTPSTRRSTPSTTPTSTTSSTSRSTPSTTPTSTTSSTTSSTRSTSSTTSIIPMTTMEILPEAVENEANQGDHSLTGKAPPPSGQGSEGQGQQNGTVNIVGNDLVMRRYLLPAAWRSVTFVDRKLKLNSGKIVAFDFLFEDTRDFLDGMFPGMRLQIWTPHLTKQWGVPIQYTLKCEKVVDKDDVTNTVNKTGRPVTSGGQNQTGRNGTLVSLDVSDVDCMHVTLEDHIGFCSTDLVLPVPYDWGTDGQVDWMFNDVNSFTAVNDTATFKTLEALPIPATFSVGVDIIYDENC